VLVQQNQWHIFACVPRYIDQQDQLTLKGELLSNISTRHDYAVELMTLGALDELYGNELAEVW